MPKSCCRRMKRSFILIACVATLLLSGCARSVPEIHYNGTRLSEEALLAMATSFETEAETEPETEAPEETDEPEDGIVHWTEGGTVWHEWQTCSHLSRKDTIITGTIEEAKTDGKTRGCAFCTKENQQNEDK